jgi:dethiobiotin synthetase
MTGRLVVVTGTGTEIGKTWVAEALLLALGRRGVRAAGIKPVESGVAGPGTDADRLRRASSFHVKHSGARLAEPVSPHLAARREGIHLDVDQLTRDARLCLADVDVLLVELPGGLFTPVTDQVLNADFAARLAPDALLLVAPDRLGVLHDTIATVRAAAAAGLTVDAIVLVAPEHPDASTGTNAPELARFLPTRVAGPVPRAALSILADHPAVTVIAATLPR